MCEAAALELDEPPPNQSVASAVSAQPAPLSGLTLMRGLRAWMWESPFSSAQGALTSGTFQTGFALFLGCNNVLLGVLAAIPPLVGLLQLVASYVAHLVASRRKIVGIASVTSRLLWGLILAIPLVLPRSMWIGAFLVLTFLSSALMSVTAPLWMDWIGDIVPAGKRGRYFGLRNVYGGLTAMVVSVAGGAFLDGAIKRLHWPPADAFAVVFGVSCLLAIAAFACCMSSPDVAEMPKSARPSVSLTHAVETYLAPFRDLNYRHVILMTLAVVGAQSFAGNFFVVYQLQALDLSYSAVQILGIASSVSALAAMPLLGYLADKYGNKPVLILSTLLVLPIPIMWCTTVPDSFPGLYTFGAGGALVVSGSKLMIVAINVISSIGWSGVGMAQFNLAIGAAPKEARSAYITAGTAASGLVGAISPTLGGLMMHVLRAFPFPEHGLVRSNYDALFVVSALLRLFILASAFRLTEIDSRSARYVLGRLRTSNPIGAVSAISKLSHSGDSHVRQRAAAALGRIKAPIAVEELVKALDDVALPVRETAAEALGQIGDARAVSPLLDKLKDPSAGIASEAAAALGKIGHHSALPDLVAAARREDGLTPRRIAAIDALGMLSEPEALDQLAELVGHPSASIRIATLRALTRRSDGGTRDRLRSAVLGRWAIEDDQSVLALLADCMTQLGDPSLAVEIAHGLGRCDAPGTRKELLNAIGSLIGGRDALYPYLALDRFAADETVAKLLTGLQRQMRPVSRSAVGAGTAARSVVRLRQALTAYGAGEQLSCAVRLGEAAELLVNNPNRPPRPFDSVCLEVMRIVCGRFDSAEGGNEDLLLLVFLVRMLAVG